MSLSLIIYTHEGGSPKAVFSTTDCDIIQSVVRQLNKRLSYEPERKASALERQQKLTRLALGTPQTPNVVAKKQEAADDTED